MANGYINIAHLYKRMPVLTDTNGDHLIAVSDLRTAIALAAAETGDVHPMPCKIGDKVYTVSRDIVLDTYSIEEETVTEVGVNGLFVSAVEPPSDDFGWFYEFADFGKRWYLHQEDAAKEIERREDIERGKAD